MNALDAILRADDCMAVLTRDVSVRLIDISGSGCLLESDSRLREGLTGTLRVQIETAEYLDDVRIVRCASAEGAFRIGAEFLWTTSPGERSLRRVLNRLQTRVLGPALNGSIRRM